MLDIKNVGFLGSLNISVPIEFIGFVSTSNPQDSSSTPPNKNLNFDSGWLESDFLVCAMAADVNAVDVASGWTLGYDGGSSSPNSLWMYRIKETSTSVSVPPDTAAMVMCFRNVNATSPLDATPVQVVGSISDPDSASITTVTNNAMVLSIGYLDDDVVTTVTPPTDFTLVGFETNSGTWDSERSSVMAAYKVQESPAAVNPSAWVTSGDDAWVASTIALKPA